MAKLIKFDLIIDGNKVKTFEELQDNLHPDLLPYVKNGKLAKWFASRDMADKVTACQAIDPDQSDVALLSAVCVLLELEADEDILQELLDAAQKLAAATPVLTPSTEVSVDSNVVNWEEFYPENREEAKKLPLIQEHPWLLNGKITNVVLKALKIVQRTHDRPDEHKSLCYHGEYGRYNIMYESLTDTVNDFYDLLHLDNEEIRKRFKMIIKNFTSSPELLELLIESPLMQLFTIVHPDVIRLYGPENVESYMYSFN